MALLPHALTNSFDRGEKVRLALFCGAIVLMHVVGWGLLLSVAAQYPALVGLGGLAYSFGLRHAFDADHISAIDNTTRKLLQDGQRPVGVGFFFSLGPFVSRVPHRAGAGLRRQSDRRRRDRRKRYGFKSDLTYTAIVGVCGTCQSSST
jgi:hypothetical protein